MRILLVEDDSDDAEFLETCLKRYGKHSFELDRVATMESAVAALQSEIFAVVLLDLNLPDAAGIDCVERIQRANEHIPIVVLSGQGDEDYAIQILNKGVQDYLVKWEGDGRTILRAIRYAVERKRTESKLNYLARYDSLTDIPNRKYLREQLERATNRAGRTGRRVGLLFLDLDRFKTINDTLGHHCGDLLLRDVVSRLQIAMRSGDLLARLGGDEFAVIVEDLESALQLEAVAKRIIEAFSRPFEIDGRSVQVTASIGLTMYPTDHREAGGLLNTADIAMYQAKDRGRNNFKFYTQKMHDEILRYHRIESDLKRALSNEEFSLVYQPQFRLRDKKVHALEALLRWHHPERGLVLPGEFIEVAEASGYIVPIGHWVVSRVCQQLRAWEAEGLPLPRVAINVAAAHARQPDFVAQMTNALARFFVDPRLIELELTEHSLMDDTEAMRDCLQRLRNHGFRVAIDDFGTGYSCLSYLRKFSIDVLKIDRSFVVDLDGSEDGQAICTVILNIAHQLGLECVAEGIENRLQLQFLTDHGCAYGQGYLFSQPVEAAEIAARFLPNCEPQIRTASNRLESARSA